MNRWLIRSVGVAALAMGGLALTGTAAHADWNSGPNIGIGNGNQSSFTVQAPINVCGNSLAIIGFASANCDGGGAYAVSGNGGNSSGAGANNANRSNRGGNANANGVNHKKTKKQSNNASNNATNNAGNRSYRSNSFGGNNSYGSNSFGNNGGGGGGGAFASSNGGGDWSTGYNFGIGNGNQSSFTVQAPINISCNSIALIGFASSC